MKASRTTQALVISWNVAAGYAGAEAIPAVDLSSYDGIRFWTKEVALETELLSSNLKRRMTLLLALKAKAPNGSERILVH